MNLCFFHLMPYDDLPADAVASAALEFLAPPVKGEMMPLARPPSFEQFDPSIAESFVHASESASGLPSYLGVRIVELGPGRLVATMEARAELLTPFGTLHGGVMAGLVDHVLGCVVYPLMQRGQWAATTEFKLNYQEAR